MTKGITVDELIVFSDHHAHPFSYGAKEVEINGVLYNSRLVESYNTLKQIEDYASAYKIKKVIFGGDLFHTRNAVPTEAFNLTFSAIQSLANKREVHLLTGNHDYNDRKGLVHSLHAFRAIPNVKVWGWDSPSLCHKTIGHRKDDYSIHFVPHTENKKLAQETIQFHANERDVGPKLLISHLGMQGARVGSDYVLVHDNDITVDDIPWQSFTGCLFGHYHEHQQLFHNGWYIGATHQHNWGDVNTKRGFLHVRIYVDSIDFEFVESNASRFIMIKENEISNIDIRDKDFVRVITNRKLNDEDMNKIREIIPNSEIVYLSKETKLDIVELDDKVLSPETMLSTWIAANKNWIESNQDIKEEDLLNYGKALLAKAGKNGE